MHLSPFILTRVIASVNGALNHFICEQYELLLHYVSMKGEYGVVMTLPGLQVHYCHH